jgi:hypothetical protein
MTTVSAVRQPGAVILFRKAVQKCPTLRSLEGLELRPFMGKEIRRRAFSSKMKQFT